jgi:hypothetical protein
VYKIDYNLRIPAKAYISLKKIAKQEKTTIAELLRRATRLLLFIQSARHDSSIRSLVECKSEIKEIVSV